MCSPCLRFALFSALCASSYGALRSLVSFLCLRSGPGRVARRGALPLPAPRGSPPSPPCRWALPPFPRRSPLFLGLARAKSDWFAHAPPFSVGPAFRAGPFFGGAARRSSGGRGACPARSACGPPAVSGPSVGPSPGLPRSCLRRGLGSCSGGLGLLGSVSGGQ